ncbi:MAG: hypothetical protein AB2L14_21450 [Candidatus Xenobiia bacterium LiM19]
MKQIMRQILLSLALLILCAAVAVIPAAGAAAGDEKKCEGCDGQCQKKGSGDKMKQFQKELGLTDSQVQQWKNLRERHKSDRKAHKQAVQEKITKVLTPDQMALWDKNRESMQCEKGQKPDKETMMKRRKALMMEMGLTDTQKKEIKTILKEERKKQRSIMESELQSILTPEQYKKFQEKMKGHMQNGGFKNREGRKGTHTEYDKNKQEKIKASDKTTKNPLEFEYK